MTRDFKEDTRAGSSQYGISWMLGGVAVGLLAGIILFNLMGNKSATTNAATNPTAPNTATPAANAATPAANPATTNPSASAGSALTPPATGTPPDTRPGFSYHAVLPVISMDDSIAPVALENPDPAPKATQVAAKPEDNAKTNPSAKPEKADKTNDKTNQQAAAKPEKPAKPAEKPQAAPDDEAPSGGAYMFQLGAYRSQEPALQLQARARRQGMNTRVEQATVNGQVWYRIRIGPTKDEAVASRWRQSISSMGISPIMVRM